MNYGDEGTVWRYGDRMGCGGREEKRCLAALQSAFTSKYAFVRSGRDVGLSQIKSLK